MNIKEHIIEVKSLEQLPSIQDIKSISRELKLKMLFKKKTKKSRVVIGEKWKLELDDNFLVTIHTIKDEINIYKLISDQEIENNKIFFEDCAREYGRLGKQLISEFTKTFNVSYGKFPMNLKPHREKHYDQIGEMGEWEYYFHGFHCAFTNKKTGQHIEVPLTYGQEFGQLDPYFFSKFMKSTLEFQPLPVEIYDDYWDGKRILDVMLRLGIFREISSDGNNQKSITL